MPENAAHALICCRCAWHGICCLARGDRQPLHPGGSSPDAGQDENGAADRRFASVGLGWLTRLPPRLFPVGRLLAGDYTIPLLVLERQALWEAALDPTNDALLEPRTPPITRLLPGAWPALDPTWQRVFGWSARRVHFVAIHLVTNSRDLSNRTLTYQRFERVRFAVMIDWLPTLTQCKTWGFRSRHAGDCDEKRAGSTRWVRD